MFFKDLKPRLVRGFFDTGLWLAPYTGQSFSLASDLDVEHIDEDPENLWLVDDGRNQSKGDKGPDGWMPPYELVQTVQSQKFM
ncbi:hypothetical protein [Microbulbifer sp. GL-2]|uniref:hypothetical protein n=1 Tax=Microbulbifer sp. GL-2 TaxID=2591606 RepID=UPI001163D67C|nr:hypothetical protein [Microbulbifer sp. GL-2]BBM03965.1 hypothetical protein GL2_40390 [Microbulbifer sp. GL-2]